MIGHALFGRAQSREIPVLRKTSVGRPSRRWKVASRDEKPAADLFPNPCSKSRYRHLL